MYRFDGLFDDDDDDDGRFWPEISEIELDPCIFHEQSVFCALSRNFRK